MRIRCSGKLLEFGTKSDVLIRVICKFGRWGSSEDYDLANFISAGNVTAFFCPLSNDWVNVGHGFCEDCRIKHLTQPDDSHACVFHRQLKCENT